MASKKKKKRPSAKKSGGRVHIRTVSTQLANDFHAYAKRRGVSLSSLVVTLLMQCLDAEKVLTVDAEQI